MVIVQGLGAFAKVLTVFLKALVDSSSHSTLLRCFVICILFISGLAENVYQSAKTQG